LETKLKNAGCEIDITGAEWFTCGDFTSTKITDTSEFKIGERVRHPTFGDGMITKIHAFDDDTEFMVAFDTAGLKKLLLSLARLEKIR